MSTQATTTTTTSSSTASRSFIPQQPQPKSKKQAHEAEPKFKLLTDLKLTKPFLIKDLEHNWNLVRHVAAYFHAHHDDFQKKIGALDKVSKALDVHNKQLCILHADGLPAQTKLVEDIAHYSNVFEAGQETYNDVHIYVTILLHKVKAVAPPYRGHLCVKDVEKFAASVELLASDKEKAEREVMCHTKYYVPAHAQLRVLEDTMDGLKVQIQMLSDFHAQREKMLKKEAEKQAAAKDMLRRQEKTDSPSQTGKQSPDVPKQGAVSLKTGPTAQSKSSETQKSQAPQVAITSTEKTSEPIKGEAEKQAAAKDMLRRKGKTDSQTQTGKQSPGVSTQVAIPKETGPSAQSKSTETQKPQVPQVASTSLQKTSEPTKSEPDAQSGGLLSYFNFWGSASKSSGSASSSEGTATTSTSNSSSAASSSSSSSSTSTSTLPTTQSSDLDGFVDVTHDKETETTLTTEMRVKNEKIETLVKETPKVFRKSKKNRKTKYKPVHKETQNINQGTTGSGKNSSTSSKNTSS